MAKAKQIGCPDQGPDPQKWVAELLKGRFAEVLSERGSALDRTKIEGVHRMRVATRRLRSSLRDFDQMIDCPPVKKVRKGLKHLADELGEVRDHDVAIVVLEELMSKTDDPGVREGISLFIDERRTLREQEYVDLLKVISVTSIEDLQRKFISAVDAALGQRDLFEPTSLSEAGRDVITARVGDLEDLGNGIYEPFNEEALHDLRIAAKNLRYAIELFGPCWPGSLDPFAVEVAKMQSSLGDVHDCDVWIGLMSKRLKKKGKSKPENGPLFEAAAWLLSEFVRKRSRAYRSSLKLWRAWKASVFMDRLGATVGQAQVTAS